LWGDNPQRLWQSEQEGRTVFPMYDVLLVDEAQFFAAAVAAPVKSWSLPRFSTVCG
jgi:hypothetical protein